MRPLSVSVHASDPVTRRGVAAMLADDRVEIVGDEAAPAVVVLAEPEVTGRHVDAVRRVRGAKCVVVTDGFAAADILFAVQNGVVSVLPTAGVSPRRLVSAVLGAADGSVAVLPGELQSALLRQLQTLRSQVLEPCGMTLQGMGPREVDAVRLVAEGFRTSEIAAELACSEATVKAMLRGVMTRLGLTSKTHTVAYAFRAGLIS
ncbi:response regulator transcription factor [Amycolatopsis sp. NPDC059657]|uniref:helix-turn-helix transcriptional regulator n=1 Tax=Amycolatopsis sp. NPDC059657 TaxID=3346899 RepID=UPI00366F98CA